MRLALDIPDHLIERCGLTRGDVKALCERHVVHGISNVLQLHLDQRELTAPGLRVEDLKAEGQLLIVARDRHGCRTGD